MSNQRRRATSSGPKPQNKRSTMFGTSAPPSNARAVWRSFRTSARPRNAHGAFFALGNRHGGHRVGAITPGLRPGEKVVEHLALVEAGTRSPLRLADQRADVAGRDVADLFACVLGGQIFQPVAQIAHAVRA